MLSDIADHIASNFKDADTKILTVENRDVTNNMESSVVNVSNQKNLIVLIRNTSVLGSVSIKIANTADTSAMDDKTGADNGTGETPEPTATATEVGGTSTGTASTGAPIGGTSVGTSATPNTPNATATGNSVAIAQVVNSIRKMDDEKTIQFAVPRLGENDSRIKVNPKGLGFIVNADPNSMQQLLAPGGEDLLIVIAKGVHNINVELSRESYLQRVCPPATICESNKTDNEECTPEDVLKTTTFWITVLILVFIIFVLFIFLMYTISGGRDSKYNSGDDLRGIETIDTIEPVGIKLGSLKKFP